MINFSTAVVSPISIHRIGRILEEEFLGIKSIPLTITNEDIRDNFLHFLLCGFKDPIFFNFDIGLDERDSILSSIAAVFGDKEELHTISKQLAETLYNKSQHPAIKSGDYLMCHFQDLIVEDEVIDAIGIFKSETTDIFLKLQEGVDSYRLDSFNGLKAGMLDKGCLVLNSNATTGYKVCLFDKTGSVESKFWINDFLGLVPREDEYHMTSHYIQMTKDFVEDRKKNADNDFSGKEAVTVMQKSENFFKQNESFDEGDYLNDLFGEGMEEEFQDYKDQYQNKKGYGLDTEFEISDVAIKKNSSVFKSVIKLDKNFHVYVHGDRSKIERGEDDFGRKFYKLYYEDES